MTYAISQFSHLSFAFFPLISVLESTFAIQLSKALFKLTFASSILRDLRAVFTEMFFFFPFVVSAVTPSVLSDVIIQSV